MRGEEPPCPSRRLPPSPAFPFPARLGASSPPCFGDGGPCAAFTGHPWAGGRKVWQVSPQKQPRRPRRAGERAGEEVAEFSSSGRRRRLLHIPQRLEPGAAVAGLAPAAQAQRARRRRQRQRRRQLDSLLFQPPWLVRSSGSSSSSARWWWWRRWGWSTFFASVPRAAYKLSRVPGGGFALPPPSPGSRKHRQSRVCLAAASASSLRPVALFGRRRSSLPVAQSPHQRLRLPWPRSEAPASRLLPCSRQPKLPPAPAGLAAAKREAAQRGAGAWRGREWREERGGGRRRRDGAVFPRGAAAAWLLPGLSPRDAQRESRKTRQPPDQVFGVCLPLPCQVGYLRR